MIILAAFVWEVPGHPARGFVFLARIRLVHSTDLKLLLERPIIFNQLVPEKKTQFQLASPVLGLYLLSRSMLNAQGGKAYSTPPWSVSLVVAGCLGCSTAFGNGWLCIHGLFFKWYSGMKEKELVTLVWRGKLDGVGPVDNRPSTD